MEKNVSGVLMSPSMKRPIAHASALPASASSGQTISLNAASSVDPNLPPQPLTYSWVQIAGTTVVLSNAKTAIASFIAPTVTVATPMQFTVTVRNAAALDSSVVVAVTVYPPAPPPGVNFSMPITAMAGSTVNLTGVVSNGATFAWSQTAGEPVTLNGADTLRPSFIAPRGPAVLTLVLTATNASGASATATRTITIAPDTVTLGTIAWDNRKNKGKLTMVAHSSLITAGMTTYPTMTATFWNNTLPSLATGSESHPISIQMTLTRDAPGLPVVCGTALPCFEATLTNVIADSSNALTTPVFLAPTTVMIKSSLGGTATATGNQIRLR
jgi:hypothetical protein